MIPVREAIPEPPVAGAVLGAGAARPGAARTTGVGARRGGDHHRDRHRERPHRDPVGALDEGAATGTAVFGLGAPTRFAFVHSLFPWLTGLADGLAPKEMALRRQSPPIRPNWAATEPPLGPPIPALCGGDSAEGGGRLAGTGAE